MDIKQLCKEKFLYFDGGTGTMLQAAGLKPGEKPEEWNIKHPDKITALHKAYLNAGSDFVTTNTFGSNRLKFGSSYESIIKSGVECAKSAAASCGHGFVALDIGPTGKLLEPIGDLPFSEAVKIFAEQIKAGRGADVVIIETMNDSLETKAAVLAAKENCDLPVIVSNVYDRNSQLMTGASPEAMAAMLEGLRVDAFGANCSLGPKQMLETAKRLAAVASVPIIISPNAGLPEIVNDETVYNVTAEEFAASMAEIAKCGVSILGGCCGTTPDYIRKTIEFTTSITPAPIKDKDITVVSSYTTAVSFGEKPVLIGERINPTGKKLFKQALRDNNIDYILGEGLKQAESGADVLDVNVGLPEIDEPEMMERVVKKLQEVTDLPLQIDTTDPSAMERALRAYNGKAMINSVSGKKESMDAVFPLAAKYGGVIVALTLDEDGIPDTAEKRIEIAEKILKEAEKYGISKKDIIVDPLVMAVSSDSNAANITLKAVKMLKNLGFRTSLGVSNISFGLPSRETISSAFFTMALENGLDAAIMNPNSHTMMTAYKTFMCLSGRDEACLKYIDFVSGEENKETEKTELTLSGAIIKGLKDKAAEIAGKAETEPMTLINGEIIPALDTVGKDFESGKLFLPQLLMSAEASAAAFDVLKKKIGKSTAVKAKFVLATVKGDVHDIGKNIVRVLLENYGYDVIDLGRDVPPETVVETVLREKAPIVGLSALMTTTVPSMAETIRQLREKCDVKIVVGGAVLTEEYAEMVGADKYCGEAMETVRYAESLNL